MAAIRTLRPLLRTSTFSLRPMATQIRTLADSATAPSLFNSTARVTGGRQGHAKSAHLDVALGMPKELGGDGSKVNPEELFAAGYGACFQGAMGASAGILKIKLPQGEDNVVDCKVHLVGDAKKADFNIRVDMKVTLKGIGKEDAEKVIEKTKEVCPYSRATKGSMTTNVELVVL